jgi:hypothetical protein
MKKQSLLVLCASWALVAFTPGPAKASTPVTVNFSGILDSQTQDPNGSLAAVGIGPGSPFQGTVVYDASVPYTYDLSLGNGAYNAYYAALLSFQLTVTTSVGSYTFGFNNNAIPPGPIVSDFIYPSHEQMEFGTSGNGFTPLTPIPPTTPSGYTQDWTVELYLYNGGPSPLTTTASLPASINLPDWNTRWVVFSSFAEQGSSSVMDYQLHGALALPAPAPAMPRPCIPVGAALLALAGALALARRPLRERRS